MFKRATLLIAALFCVGMTAASPAAAEHPRTVRVTDQTGKPIHGVPVLEKTPNGAILLGTTNQNGDARVSVPDGAPVYVAYENVNSAVKAAIGPQLYFSVGSKTIATVVARPQGPGKNVGTQSALALLSGGLQNALSFLPNYRSAAEGGSTDSRLDGTPLMLPSMPGSSTFAVPSNLISSFTPDQADDGSVVPDYHLQSPTAHPQQAFELKTGAPGLSVWRGTFTGPHYGFVVADQTQEGWFAGKSLTDVSGFDYDHSQNQHELDASLNLGFQLGSVNVSAVGFASRSRQSDLNLIEPGGMLEGSGPGNWVSSRLANGYIRAMSSHGKSSWMLIHADFAGAMDNDDRNATIVGMPFPSDSGFSYSGRFDQLSYSQGIGGVLLTAKVENTLANARSFVSPFENLARTTGTTYDLNIARNAKNVSRTFDLTAIQDAGAFPVHHVNAAYHETRWNSRSRLSWSLYSAQAQVIQTYYANALRLAAPGAADFSCGGKSAFAQGPSRVAPDAPHDVAATVTGTRSIDANTQVTAGGFYSDTTNALVIESESGTVPLSSGYLDVLNMGYARLCGGAAPLTSANVFLTHYVTVPRLIGKEMYVSVTRRLGTLSVTGNYEAYGDTVLGVPSAAPGVASTLVNGAQVWNVPLHRASLVLQHSGAGIMEAVGAAYVSSNNAAHLPANLIVSTGISVPAPRGHVEFSVQNLFGSYAGEVLSTQFSSPSITTQGPVAFLATPVRRTWSISYQFSTHDGAPTP